MNFFISPGSTLLFILSIIFFLVFFVSLGYYIYWKRFNKDVIIRRVDMGGDTTDYYIPEKLTEKKVSSQELYRIYKDK